MDIIEATRSFETWLGRGLKLSPADLRKKHRMMAESPGRFFRATYYRWCQRWPELCPNDQTAPRVLAVGDLHAENFGLWRDAEGRLVWGVNDFDEAAPLPFSNDLARLATSLCLARESGEVRLPFAEICQEILRGYAESLASGGRPIVLGEHHRWLRELAQNEARSPAMFWAKLAELPRWRGKLLPLARTALVAEFPGEFSAARIVRRPAGLGSLGRERYAVVGDWQGGKAAREAKALTVSALAWARGQMSGGRIWYDTVVRRAVRCGDPALKVAGAWVVRRLAPDAGRIDLASLPAVRDEARLCFEMGWETANIHLGSPRSVRAIRQELARRPGDWLVGASAVMAQAVLADWKTWKRDGFR